jgi:S-DNA-T family DNA segregation ATPase FtsK/SpoIIIE
MRNDTYTQIETVLESFGVTAEVVGHTEGPNVCQYHVTLGPGQAISAILKLEADLALRLSAMSVRIVQLPGQPYLGIELPNPSPYIVRFTQLDPNCANYALPLILGVMPDGNTLCANLATMPHLLVAGTTGSGKSIALHTMILSLLGTYDHDELAFVMIDPKQVELSYYSDLPHMMFPAATDLDTAIERLNWLVEEMEARFTVLSEIGARDIAVYNQRMDPADRLPYIVTVIDELADLMLSGKKLVEDPLVRLAQKARAVGIHLIVATQRPSSKVITGLIKANFPTRIAMRVASKVDSRVILDANGAEALLGKGDMLFSHGSTVQRLQGAYVSIHDIETIVGELECVQSKMEKDSPTIGERSPSSEKLGWIARLLWGS